MYTLSQAMLQKLEKDLRTYHNLFSGYRCSGEEMQELISRAIESDTHRQHHARWKKPRHSDQPDITIHAKGGTDLVKIKSGKWTRKGLTLSGHRLGRFKENFIEITRYLNNLSTDMLAIPCTTTDNKKRRAFTYKICQIDIQYLTGLRANQWRRVKAQYTQTNLHGVEFSIRPTMSWQIWWTIPRNLIQGNYEIQIRKILPPYITP